jgi:hypothetical protein
VKSIYIVILGAALAAIGATVIVEFLGMNYSGTIGCAVGGTVGYAISYACARKD